MLSNTVSSLSSSSSKPNTLINVSITSNEGLYPTTFSNAVPNKCCATASCVNVEATFALVLAFLNSLFCISSLDTLAS